MLPYVSVAAAAAAKGGYAAATKSPAVPQKALWSKVKDYGVLRFVAAVAIALFAVSRECKNFVAAVAATVKSWK